MIANNKSIRCLRIGNNNIGNDGIKDFVDTIIDSNNLYCLDIWGNKVTSTRMELTQDMEYYYKEFIITTLTW